MNAVTCSQCGSIRHFELVSSLERPPCTVCGATALHIGASIDESLKISDSVSSMLVPGVQDRDWKIRWEQIKRDYHAVSAPSHEVMSAEAIHFWFHRLCAFFIHTYHLKDALNEAAPLVRMGKKSVERAIKKDKRLALLADLANMDKHTVLTSTPRSGIIPVIVQLAGVDVPSGGWLLAVEIQHGSLTLNGLRVARDAVDAWQEKLTMWGLI